MLKTKYNVAYVYAYTHGGFVDCKHNEWINCVKGAKCKNCGWNPVVTNRRKSRLLRRKEDLDEYTKRNAVAAHS